MVFTLTTSISTSQTLYKCTLDDGSIVFSDIACVKGAEKYQLKESYTPDPLHLNTPTTNQTNTPTKLNSESKKAKKLQASPKQIESNQATAYKCTSSRGIYYTTTGCGSSNDLIMTTRGLAMTVNKPFQDGEQVVPSSEACSWATQRGKKGGLSSDIRRSARALAREVC
jgi:hypothetical protein